VLTPFHATKPLKGAVARGEVFNYVIKPNRLLPM
jgi:hypothetical protein